MKTKGMFAKDGRLYKPTGFETFSETKQLWVHRNGRVYYRGSSYNVLEKDGLFHPSVSLPGMASPIFGKPAKALETAKRRALQMALDNQVIFLFDE